MAARPVLRRKSAISGVAGMEFLTLMIDRRDQHMRDRSGRHPVTHLPGYGATRRTRAIDRIAVEQIAVRRAQQGCRQGPGPRTGRLSRLCPHATRRKPGAAAVECIAANIGGRVIAVEFAPSAERETRCADRQRGQGRPARPHSSGEIAIAVAVAGAIETVDSGGALPADPERKIGRVGRAVESCRAAQKAE